MEHQNKKKRPPTLEDFSAKKMEDCEEAKTSINENPDKREPIHEAIPSLDDKLQGFEKTLMAVMDQKLAEFQSKMALGERKSLLKKRNDRVLYVGDKEYPTFQKFKESANEPLKETLKKVVRAAEKYLEITGGSKPQ
jgi:hypothetical protein